MQRVAIQSCIAICLTMCGRRQSSRKRRRLEDLPESETVQQCLQAIGSGEAHIATAIRFARAVVNDGFKHPTVMEFASLGGPSLEVGNGERDLHRWVDCRAHNLELWNLKLQLQMPNSKRTELVAVPTLLPWVLMHALWTADRWEKACLAQQDVMGCENSGKTLPASAGVMNILLSHTWIWIIQYLWCSTATVLKCTPTLNSTYGRSAA